MATSGEDAEKVMNRTPNAPHAKRSWTFSFLEALESAAAVRDTDGIPDALAIKGATA